MKEQLNAGNSFCSLDDQSLFFSIILAAIGISKADSVLVIVVISLFRCSFSGFLFLVSCCLLLVACCLGRKTWGILDSRLIGGWYCTRIHLLWSLNKFALRWPTPVCQFLPNRCSQASKRSLLGRCNLSEVRLASVSPHRFQRSKFVGVIPTPAIVKCFEASSILVLTRNAVYKGTMFVGPWHR